VVTHRTPLAWISVCAWDGRCPKGTSTGAGETNTQPIMNAVIRFRSLALVTRMPSTRQSKLEPELFLRSLPVYRYGRIVRS
jgi:hypothetical protein